MSFFSYISTYKWLKLFKSINYQLFSLFNEKFMQMLTKQISTTYDYSYFVLDWRQSFSFVLKWTKLSNQLAQIKLDSQVKYLHDLLITNYKIIMDKPTFKIDFKLRDVSSQQMIFVWEKYVKILEKSKLPLTYRMHTIYCNMYVWFICLLFLNLSNKKPFRFSGSYSLSWNSVRQEKHMFWNFENICVPNENKQTHTQITHNLNSHYSNNSLKSFWFYLIIFIMKTIEHHHINPQKKLI